ncbi:hypothetical protein D3C85_720710 [compost metagenome]
MLERSSTAAAPLNNGFLSISVYNKSAFALFNFSTAAIPPFSLIHCNVSKET